MLQSIEALKAKQAQELATLEAQHKFAALLPVAPSFVHLGEGSEPQARISVEGLGGALEVLKLFTIVPFTEYRNGTSLILKPIALCPGIDPDKHCDQWAASLVSDTSFGLESTTVKVKFFARIPGAFRSKGVAKIILEVSEPKGADYRHNYRHLGARCEYVDNSRSQVKRGSIRPNAALNGYGDRFHSWSVPDGRALHEFLFTADYANQDASGPKELSHLFGMFQNMADEFDNKGDK